jgi:hypothetical protein
MLAVPPISSPVPGRVGKGRFRRGRVRGRDRRAPDRPKAAVVAG